MNKFGILAWPAYSTKESNPYNFLIYSEIEAKGYKVYEFNFSLKNVLLYSFSSGYKVFHIHWPSNILTWSTALQAKRRLGMFFLFLKILKLTGKKIVWTVHNLQSHESEHPKLQQKLYQMLYHNADGFISLNEGGLEQIKTLSASTKKQRFAYIPHPHYKGYYPNNIASENARIALGIAEEKKVFLFLGQVRKYKNVMGLIDAFNALGLPDKFLLIAGKVHDDMRDEISNERMNNRETIMIHDTFIEDKDLQLYFNSADLVVNPYTHIFNSGSVFLNMSFNKPTLAPAIGAFPELQMQTGSDYIKLFTDEISATALNKAMQEAIAEKDQIRDTDLSVFSPAEIARQTLSFYNDLFKMD